MQAAAPLATQRLRLGIFGVLVVGALIAVLVELRAQTAPSDEALVLTADQKLGDAQRTGDKSVARRLLSLQFSFVDENGTVHDRRDFLADLKGLAAAAPTGPQVKRYGRIAMVTGHRHSALDDDVFFLDLWAKQRGAWRALVMQDVVLAALGALESEEQAGDFGSDELDELLVEGEKSGPALDGKTVIGELRGLRLRKRPKAG